MNSEFVDEPLLRTLAATLLAEFSHVRLYHPAAQVLMFLASEEPLDLELQAARSGQPFTADIMHYSRIGMNSVEDLLAALAMDREGVEAFAADAPISTDDHNLMATQSRSLADGLYLSELNEIFPAYDPLVRRGSWIYTRLMDDLNFGYIAQRLVLMGQPGRAVAAADVNPRDSNRLLMYGVVNAASGETARAEFAFKSALAADPSNAQARYLLTKGQLATLNTDAASEEAIAIASGLPAEAAAVVEGWGYGAARDYPALAGLELDAVLGRSRITDAWYPEVVRLRAEWRTNIAIDRERYAFDALRLIERAILLVPSEDLYLLRAVSAIVLNEGDVVVESSRQIIAYIQQDLRQADDQSFPIRPDNLAKMKQNLISIITHLEGELAGGDRARADVVLSTAREALAQVEAYSDPEN
jgi:tetratricopeptide (TPR) repeat protein